MKGREGAELAMRYSMRRARVAVVAIAVVVLAFRAAAAHCEPREASLPDYVDSAKIAKTTSPLPGYVAAAEHVKATAAFPPFGADVFHVQGLYMTNDYIFFTSVDKYSAKGWLYKFDRRTMELSGRRNLAKGLYVHPSGFDFDGRYFWIAMAVYKRETASYVLAVDPDTLKASLRFEVDDHIGLMAVHGDAVIGANWNAETFYFWDRGGNLLEKRASPTSVGYQDCKGVNGLLACVSGNTLDWIDIAEWKLLKRFKIGDSDIGNPLGREGVALHGDKVYLLPDDGADARVYECEFMPGEQAPDMDR